MQVVSFERRPKDLKPNFTYVFNCLKLDAFQAHGSTEFNLHHDPSVDETLDRGVETVW